MNTIEFVLAMLFVVIASVHYWRDGSGATGLPPSHPRRQRAHAVFPFVVAFGVLAAITWSFGMDGPFGYVFLVGIVIWFLALWSIRRRIPKEAEILAYEAANSSGRPHPWKPDWLLFLWRLRERAEAAHAQNPTTAQSPRKEIEPLLLERPSVARLPRDK